MEDISWPHVRRVILNDSYNLDINYIKRLVKLFPDLRVLGFHRLYDNMTWVIILESKKFPYWAGSSDSGYVPATSLSSYLKKEVEDAQV